MEYSGALAKYLQSEKRRSVFGIRTYINGPDKPVAESSRSEDESKSGAFESWLRELQRSIALEHKDFTPELFKLADDIFIADVSVEVLKALAEDNRVLYADVDPWMKGFGSHPAQRFDSDDKRDDSEGDDSAKLSKDAQSLANMVVEYVGARALKKEFGLTGSGVVVAVVDWGVNFQHVDLRQRRWSAPSPYSCGGWNIVHNNCSLYTADRGHGTMVAGLVAGDGSSGTQTGCAPGAQVMSVAVSKFNSHHLLGVDFALQFGADVIVQSWEMEPAQDPKYRLEWRAKCEKVAGRKVLHLIAAGEDDGSIPYQVGTPADCPPPRVPIQSVGGASSAIACGGTEGRWNSSTNQWEDVIWPDSASGPVAWPDYPYDGKSKFGLVKPDLCAPVFAKSCKHNRSGVGHSTFKGTSATAPIVAGCVALLIEACRRTNKPVEPLHIQEALEETCAPIYGQTPGMKENRYGAGRINVYKAYLYGIDKKRNWWA